MSPKSQAAFAGALLIAWATMPVLGAGTKSSYKSNAAFWWSCTFMPDLDQWRETSGSVAGLPNDGINYCAPTALTDVMMYIANHGFPEISPGPANWQLQANYAAATTAIAAMGTAMGTDPFKGSTGPGIVAGIHNSLDASEKFVVQVYAADKAYSPTFLAMSKVAMSGSLVSLAWGWYDVISEFFGIRTVNRLGGHVITLTRSVAKGDSKTLWSRDPGSERTGTKLDQSNFANRKHVAKDILVIDQQVNALRYVTSLDLHPTFDKVLLVDGYVGIRTKCGFSLTNNDTQLEFLQPYPMTNVSPAVDSSFPLPSGAIAVDAVFGPDLSDFVMLTVGPSPGNTPTLQRLDLSSGELSPLVAVPGATRLVFGRKRELYVLAGSVAHCFDLDASNPNVATINLPASCDALAFDDVHDEVVFLSSASHQLLRFAERLAGAPAVVSVPSSVPLLAPASLATRPSDGCVFVASSASSAVFRLEPASGGGLQVETIQVPGVGAPTGIDLDDAGHLFIASSGTLYETKPVSGSWQLTANQDWSAFPIGQRFRIARSRTNYDPAIMSGPAFDHLPAAQAIAVQTAPSIPDCGGVATVQEYGVGKPGSFGVPHLGAPTLPWIGDSLAAELTDAAPNAPAILLLGFAPLAAPFDGGTLLVNPALSLFVTTSASGSLELEFPLPADPQLCGWTIYQQMLILDPGAAGFYQTAITNGLAQTIGD